MVSRNPVHQPRIPFWISWGYFMIVNFHYGLRAFFFSCLAESLLFDVELSWKIVLLPCTEQETGLSWMILQSRAHKGCVYTVRDCMALQVTTCQVLSAAHVSIYVSICIIMYILYISFVYMFNILHIFVFNIWTLHRVLGRLYPVFLSPRLLFDRFTRRDFVKRWAQRLPLLAASW